MSWENTRFKTIIIDDFLTKFQANVICTGIDYFFLGTCHGIIIIDDFLTKFQANVIYTSIIIFSLEHVVGKQWLK
jgi:hypothetical protein